MGTLTTEVVYDGMGLWFNGSYGAVRVSFNHLRTLTSLSGIYDVLQATLACYYVFLFIVVLPPYLA